MERGPAGSFDGYVNMRFGNGDGGGSAQSRVFTLRIPLLCVLGFSFYLGWIFCLFWSPALFVPGTLDDLPIHVVRIGMTIAMFVAYVLFGLFARFFASRTGELALRCLSLVLSPVACLAGLFPDGVGFSTAVLLWAASGVGSSALLLVWSKLLSLLNRKQVFFSAAGSFFVGAFLFLATAFMPVEIAFLAMASLPVASVLLAFLGSARTLTFSLLESADPAVEAQGIGRSEEVEAADRADAPFEESQRITFMRTILLALAYSVGIGFVGACATSFQYYPQSVYVIAAGNACAAVFAVSFLVRRTKDVAGMLIEVFLPIMLICIFLFSFVGHELQLACLFVLFALLACQDIVDIANVSKSSRLFGENYVKTFAMGRILNGFGCTFGWMVGTLLNFLPGVDAAGRLFVCFALVVFLVTTTSFAVFHPGPLSYFREAKLDAARAAVAAAEAAPLQAKTEAVAARYDLTSRQAEVLLCLAQGRNASYVAQKFTISSHTAKSHIYNIYNKLGIHSQQELLDIVEAAQDGLLESDGSL